MGVKYKEYLAEKFEDDILPDICKDSESLEEAQIRSELIWSRDYGFVCNKESLVEKVEEIWNEVWEVYK
tara:strand:+ start:901 stop:1107 length:207 start_codon:yes stop_codon:yes gene_type:complete